jgi:hypothetical protein
MTPALASLNEFGGYDCFFLVEELFVRRAYADLSA